MITDPGPTLSRRRIILGALGALALQCTTTRNPDGATAALRAGDAAPEFEAVDQNGRTRRLSEFRGKPVVLYFYPKDGTPGCTREACAFRDAWNDLQATGAVVLGVSTDDVASHLRFAQDHHLQFPLLADPRQTILRAYGVGTFLGMASRVTFLIDGAGKIAQVYPSVDPAIHAQEIITAIRALAPPGTDS